MKALTIWQPWAQLIAIGCKRFETRGWSTSYRGPIAIHAGAKEFSRKSLQELPFAAQAAMIRALGIAIDRMPCGCIIATAELISVHRTGIHSFAVSEQERLFGDWAPGRFAWELANVKMLDKPIPAKGAQRLWNWEPPKGASR